MSILDQIKQLFKPGPKEQILGYSPSELQFLFRNSSVAGNPHFLKNFPDKVSLETLGVNAFYIMQLIDESEIHDFYNLINAYFQPEKKRTFNNNTVAQCTGKKANERLCFLVTDEFEGRVIRLVTDSVNFLNEIDLHGFSVPPPWVVFKDYNPHWWGGSMQGGQGYYDDEFFSPFFNNLSPEHRNNYYCKYGASQDWKNALELFYDDET